MMAAAVNPALAARVRHPAHPSRATLRSHFGHAVKKTAHAIETRISHLWATPAVAVFDHATGLPLRIDDDHRTDPHDMASTTKLMTAMLFADYVAAHGGDWDMPVEITPEDQKRPGAAADMIGPHGRHPALVKLTARQLLLAMLVRSCNAAAEAAARYAGDGDWHKGVARMNERRAAWGMMSTEYANGAGTENRHHYSTVTDMEIPLRHVIDDPRYAEVAKAARTPIFYFPGGPYQNHNLLLKTLPGMQEGKTGKTNGFSIAASQIDPHGHRLDICVLGAPSRQKRDEVVVRHLADAAAHYDAYLATARAAAAPVLPLARP